MEENALIGKINPKVVRALFKVVIDDINYEISCIYDYTKYLDNQVKRLEDINKYIIKMEKTNKQRKKENLEATVKLMLQDGENFKNYKYVLEEYRTAFMKRKEIIDNLFDEIKTIQKLRV